MLYIMRHGRTDWNARRKLQGSVDIPLNEEGRQMAREARDKYADVSFDICYCSPLQRARETATLFLEGRSIPIIIDPRLAEISFGAYEGLENYMNHPDSPIYKLFADPKNYVATDGSESFESLYARTGAFLQEVVQPDLEQGKNVLIVGHGALGSAIINQLEHIPLEHFWEKKIKNCELVPLEGFSMKE
jgi:probable phosphoglycerate mutase